MPKTLAFCPADVHLKVHRRHKDGKEHRYFSIVESRRVARQRVVHRTVVYLGEINDSQQAAWRKTLQVFDEKEQEFATLSLFPDDREIVGDVDTLQVRLGEMQLERPRAFGSCWLGCELWRQLKLDDFWQSKLPEGREAVPWEKVLRLLVVNRLLDPGSEFRVHRQWFDQTAMGELLGTDFAVAEKDRSIAAWTACWITNRSCSSICASVGRICSPRPSTCCFTI
jgi:hypothetical protein